MDLADLLGLLVDLIPDRLADARRSEARAQSVDKMFAAMQAGDPIPATVPAAFHYGDASPAAAHAWKYGRLELTPSAVTWASRWISSQEFVQPFRRPLCGSAAAR